MKIEQEEYSVEYKDVGVNEKLKDKMLAFFIEHECFTGECIAQSDRPQIAAVELLCEIADDIFKFKVDWK